MGAVVVDLMVAVVVDLMVAVVVNLMLRDPLGLPLEIQATTPQWPAVEGQAPLDHLQVMVDSRVEAPLVDSNATETVWLPDRLAVFRYGHPWKMILLADVKKQGLAITTIGLCLASGVFETNGGFCSRFCHWVFLVVFW